MMILGDKIALLRKQSGWSQEELAEKMGISRQSVSKWESASSIPDLDKIVAMSRIFGVSTDYLLKDDLQEITRSESDDSFVEEEARSVSLDEANAFMEDERASSGRVALAVALCILSPVCLILLGGFSQYANSGLTEDMAGGLGVAILLALIAVGVCILILNGMRLSKYEYLEKERISLQYGVRGLVEQKKEAFAPTYRRSVAAGVALCITGVIPLMLAAALQAGDMAYICCTGALLFLIACGVYLFVRFGSVAGSYDKLLQEGEYTPEKKEIGKRTAFFPGTYWCVATAVYLGISFYYNNWHISWIVWPVAGVLFAALYAIVNAAAKAGKP